VLAQRLARKLSTHCCEAYQPTEVELAELRISPEALGPLDGAVFYRKKGCPRCNHTGYRGRVGVFQFLRMSEEIASLAVQHASRDDIARAASANGMRSLWADGLEKVASGLTSIEELTRVLS
jgi:type II secretory ATPase GspE/PulE/Tfp pilus assembly ATPase PilB-like protein